MWCWNTIFNDSHPVFIITDFFNDMVTSDPKCFASVELGDFKGYVPVTPDFYQPIIDARKAAIGG